MSSISDDFFNDEPEVEAEKMPDFVITDEFQSAFDIAEQKDGHLFITGDAGTGKSTWLRWFLNTTKKQCVVLAPTGIAAVNVKGQTIHSFFKWPPKPMTSQDMKLMDDTEIFNAMDVLVIDEISMVRADIMDFIDEFLQINRNDMNPFGGAQVIVIGDLLQLPPVMRDDMEGARILQKYGCEYFFAADVWQQADLNLIKFTKIFRQSDPVFINILNKIRNGTIGYPELDKLNTNHYTDEDEKEAAFLCSRNEKVDKINADRIAKLNTEEKTFIMIRRGNAKNIAAYIPEVLTVKKGCKIMMLTNDAEGRWQNGTIGYVDAFTDNAVLVSIHGNQYWVNRKKWESNKHHVRKDDQGKDTIETINDGEAEQIPMKVAYAISIHKSQAQTFDSVIIDLGSGAFTGGMGYTAISRVRTIEKLFFSTPVKMNDLYFDKAVTNYLARGKYIRQ